MLAKGSDVALAKLAEQDLAGSTHVAEQLKLADAWWAFAEKQGGTIQRQIFLHAAECVNIINLDGLPKLKWEKRIRELPANENGRPMP